MHVMQGRTRTFFIDVQLRSLHRFAYIVNRYLIRRKHCLNTVIRSEMFNRHELTLIFLLDFRNSSSFPTSPEQP